MRVTVCFPFVGDSVGGSLISTAAVIDYLSEIPRYELIVLLHRDGVVAEWLTKEGIKYKICKEVSYVNFTGGIFCRLIEIYRSQRETKKYLDSNNIDIVHTNDGRMHLTWGLGSLRSATKHIWHQRTMFARSRLACLLIGASSRIFTISEYVKSTLPSVDARRAITILNPLRVGAKSPNKLQKKIERLGWSRSKSEKTSVIGFVGTFSHQKRINDFVAIAKQIVANHTRGKDVLFLLVGKEGDYSYRDIENCFDWEEFKGKVRVEKYKHNISQWYEAIDILLAPAENEGFGRNIIEAIERGSTVIASSSGGHGEIVYSSNIGILVEVGSIDQFVNAITKVLSADGPSRAVRKSARDIVIQKYDYRKISEEIALEYVTLAKEKKSINSMVSQLILYCCRK